MVAYLMLQVLRRYRCRMRRAVLLLGVLAVPVACAAQEGAQRAAQTSPPGGGTTLETAVGLFPAEAVGFSRAATFWLEADRPGQGAAVEYFGPSRAAVATVSLYDGGQGMIADRDPRLAGEFATAVAEVMALAGTWTSLRLAEGGRSEIAIPDGAPLSCARLQGTYGRQQVQMLVCLGAAAGRYLKVQVTTPQRQVVPVDAESFVTAIAQAPRASLARSLDLVEVGSPAAVAVAPARAAVPAGARDLPAQPARAVPPATDAPLSAASSPPPTARGTAAVPAQAELPAAPRPASPAADTRSNAQVEALTAAWARAWAARDVEAYLGFYATGFVGVGARDHTDWVAQRRRALDRARELRIIIEQLQVQPAADGQIEVRFRQLYRATGLSLDASKTLIWQIENGRWAIVSERVTTERRR